MSGLCVNGEAHVSPTGLERVNHALGLANRHNLVLRAVEDPDRDIFDQARRSPVSPSAYRRKRGEAFGVDHREQPGTESTHTHASQVDARRIDRVTLQSMIQ